MQLDDVAPPAEPVTELVLPAVAATCIGHETQSSGANSAWRKGAAGKGKGKAPTPPPTPSAPPTPAASAGMPPPHSGGLVPQGGPKGSSTPSYTAATTKPAKAKPAKATLLTPKQAWAHPKAKPNTPPPPCLSLMLSLSNCSHDDSLRTTAGVLAPAMVHVCNDALAADPTFTSVQVSATRWTPKGNLVIFAGLDTMYK